MLLVYLPYLTPRAEYIFKTLLPAVGVSSFSFTNDPEAFINFDGVRINYSDTQLTANELWIKPVDLLFEHNVWEQTTEVFTWDNLKAFYATEGDLPFDVFAASFYLITRYEEYLPHSLDMYGRYAHENSIAYKNQFLKQPLVNLWLQEVKEILQVKFPAVKFAVKPFRFLPTYDIDIAWTYKEKGFVRNAGGLVKSIINGNMDEAKERIRVLRQKQKDPFDVYDSLDHLHEQYSLSPVYFFLVAQQAKGYDKNISSTSPAFQQLIKRHSKKYEVGIHPSWQSGDDETTLGHEKQILEQITNTPVCKSRQHYIRMKLPDTYRQLLTAGITEDHSMGYGSINGFRASYTLPFKWFDLESNEATGLTIVPFCYMEANSLFEQQYTPEQALKELEEYYAIVKQVSGLLVTIFHNHLITEQPQQLAWRKMYQRFLQKHFTAS